MEQENVWSGRNGHKQVCVVGKVCTPVRYCQATAGLAPVDGPGAMVIISQSLIVVFSVDFKYSRFSYVQTQIRTAQIRDEESQGCVC